MKLVVFAHTPPPHHGQSYMVQLMLDGLGGDARRRPSGAHPMGVDCYHVNARFSRGLEDVGEFQGAKIFLILWFCLQAIWLRFRYGVRNLYYVPAPGKRIALWRDWLAMAICRPFFPRLILHWHAAGLAKWLESEVTIASRNMTWQRFKPVNLSIVLSRYNVADAEKLLSDRIAVVNNGIPDPCPDFDTAILPLRRRRFEEYRRLLARPSSEAPVEVRALYLAHCTREKGLFASIEAVSLANRRLAREGLPVRLRLTVAGNFVTRSEAAAFEQRCAEPDLAGMIEYAGFVSGPRKLEIYTHADLFLFPTCYLGENQPVNLIEAMAYGLPIVTTRWRSLPEMFPDDHPGLVDGQDPEEISGVILKVLKAVSGEQVRKQFTDRFTLRQHLIALAAALRSVETPP